MNRAAAAHRAAALPAALALLTVAAAGPLGALLAGPAGAAVAQATTPATERAPARFPVGEENVYDVVVGLGSMSAPRPVGEARLRIEARDTVDGAPVFRAALEMKGGIPLVYGMDNRQVSWFATDPMRTVRFEEHLREGDYRRDRQYRFDTVADTFTRYDLDRESGEWRRVPKRASMPMPDDALDEVAFLYFVRTLPLEVGRTYRFHRYFEQDGNPVVLKVLRRDRVRVPAGEFETIVVRPVIRTDGLFSEGGRAEVYLTDDSRRLIVQIRSRMDVGTLNFYLREHAPGSGAPDASPAVTDASDAGSAG